MNVLQNGITIGFFININIYDGIQGDFDDRVLTDQLYMRGYGHTMDSCRLGILYLFAIGILSIRSAAKKDGNHKKLLDRKTGE